MRKSLIYTLIIAVLVTGSFYLSSYYMGIQVKEKLYDIVNDYDNAESGLSLKIIDYQKGLLRSLAKIRVGHHDFNSFDVDLNIQHKPIFYHTDIDNKGNVYFLKLLVDARVWSSFLDKSTELFRNVSVIDANKNLDINFKLSDLTLALYQLIGFNVTNYDTKDADANFKIVDNLLSLSITGDTNNLVSEYYSAEKSSYKIGYILYLDKKNNNYLKNTLNLEFSLKVLSTKKAEDIDYKLFSDKGKLNIAVKSSLSDFISLVSGNTSLEEFILNDRDYELITNFDTTNTSIINQYNEKFDTSDLKLKMLFKNEKLINTFESDIDLNGLAITTQIDKVNLGRLKHKLNIDSDHELVSNLMGADTESFSLFDKIFLDKNNNFHYQYSLDIQNLVANGLLTGDLNLHDFLFSSSLVNTLKDKVLTSDFKLGDFAWSYNDMGMEFNIEKSNIDFSGNFNLSQYLRALVSENNEVYDADYKISMDLPALAIKSNNFTVSLQQIKGSSDFKLSRDIPGFLNTDFSMQSLLMKSKELLVSIKDLSSTSNMKQVYKFVLSGDSNFYLNHIGFDYMGNNLSLDKINYNSVSGLDNKKLEYINKLKVDDLKINNSKLGQLAFNNRFYNIDLASYEQLMLNMNSLRFGKKQELESEYDVNKEITTIVDDFLSSGLDVDNYLYLGFKTDTQRKINNKQNKKTDKKFDLSKIEQDGDNNNNLAELGNAVKIYNYLNVSNENKGNNKKEKRELLDDSLKQNNQELTLDYFLNKLNIAVEVNIDKDYLEQLLKMINSEKLFNLYANAKAIGMLKFENNHAELVFIYENPEFIINGKSFNYWNDKIKARSNRESYFDKLKRQQKGGKAT